MYLRKTWLLLLLATTAFATSGSIDLGSNISNTGSSGGSGGGGGGGSGTVLQVNSGTGLTGGPITTTGTLSLVAPTGGSVLGGVQSSLASANLFFTGLNTAGLFSSVRPSCSSLSNSANSCSVTAVTANTANDIVLRDSSGNFAMGSLTATGANLTGSLGMGGFQINNLSSPVLSSDGANKSYVDSQLAQLNPAASVFAASTSSIAGTYTNIISGVCIGDTFTVTATGALSVDGVSPAAGARILLKNQASSFQDGVWTVTIAGSVGVSPVLTRATDSDSSADFNAGQIVPIANGTVNAGSSYYQTALISTCSSDSQTWTQFQKASSAYLQSANNLSDVANVTAARSNLGIAASTAYITSGTTYLTPTPITTSTWFKFTLIGGGGGSGGLPATTNSASAGAGGGGGCQIITAGLSPNTSISIAIGAAGIGGGNAQTDDSGTAGGNTSITIGGVTYTANGGSLGTSLANQAFGSGGGTTVNCSNTGGVGSISAVGGRGSGVGTAAATLYSGGGGNSAFGWGQGGPQQGPTATGQTGASGTGFGGGGGGARCGTINCIGGGNGANGAQGIIVVDYWN